MPQGEWEVLGVFLPQLFEWRFLNVFLKQKYIRLVREKLTIFSYRQYIIGIVIYSSFLGCTLLRDRSWHLRDICSNVTVILRRNHAALQRCRDVNVAIATTALPVARLLRDFRITRWVLPPSCATFRGKI